MENFHRNISYIPKQKVKQIRLLLNYTLSYICSTIWPLKANIYMISKLYIKISIKKTHKEHKPEGNGFEGWANRVNGMVMDGD